MTPKPAIPISYCRCDCVSLIALVPRITDTTGSARLPQEPQCPGYHGTTTVRTGARPDRARLFFRLLWHVLGESLQIALPIPASGDLSSGNRASHSFKISPRSSGSWMGFCELCGRRCRSDVLFPLITMKMNYYSMLRKACFCLLLAMAGLSNVSANGPVLLGFSGGVSSTAVARYGGAADLTIGWTFTVGAQGITVSDLGFFDQGGDGLNTAHNVGIWNSGGSLLASITVPSGTAGSLVSGFRYAALSSGLSLAANQTYTIGAEITVNSSDLFWNQTAATIDPKITYGEARDSAVNNNFTSGFTDPVRSRSDLNFGEFGPNFQVVPEPGTLALLSLPLIALLGARRLRSLS